jgi:uncharacterized protein involved in outer membrane biogenesis
LRKVLIGLAVLVVAVALVILLGPQLIPAERLKQDIARQVEAATGRTLTIDGELSFTLLPAPGVSVAGVHLSNVAGAHAPDMLQLDRATVVVALMPLLSGRVEVDRIILVRPRLELEQLADGRASWRFELRAGAGGAAADAKPGASTESGSSGGTPAVQLNRVVVSDGALTWRDGATVETVSGIDATMVAQSLEGPFRLEGGLTARGIPLRLRATIGELAVDRAIPLSIVADAEGIELAVNGVVSGYPYDSRLAGRIEAKVADAGKAARALTGQPAPVLLAGREAALEGTLAANATASTLAINDLRARFGDINATGALAVNAGKTPRVDLVLNAGQLDLDALLAAAGDRSSGSGGSGAAPAGGNAGGAGAGAGATDAAAVAPANGLPAGIAGSVELKIENVLWRGGVVRQARLAAELANGALTVSQLSAQLPGGSDVSLVGFVEAPQGEPSFNGQVEAGSDDLRALLGWLAVDVHAVPADRLRKLTASSAIRASAENVTITNLDLAVDTMRLRGGVAVALRDRPGFGIGLSLDKINLDAYLPQEPAAAAPAAAAAQSAPPAGAPAATSPAPGRGIAALAGFDAIVQAKVGEVTWQGTSIRGVNLDATLQNGALELRDASVASIGGARAKVSGTLGDVAGTPRADLKLAVAAADADALLRLAGVTPPVAVGAAQVDGTLAGDFDNLRLDVALQALQATAKVRGTVQQPLDALAYDLAVDVSHAEAARLFALLAGEAPGDARLGAFGLKGTLKGAPDNAAFDLAATVGDGEASLKGSLAGLANKAASGTVALKANHPDLGGLLRAVSPGYRPALAPLGPLEIDTMAQVAPQQVRLDGLAGKAGPVAYKGDATVALGGARPKLTASLATSEIVVDWFLPPQPGGGGTGGGAQGTAAAGTPGNVAAGAPARGGERWSREPLDLSALRALDAEIGLTAPAIGYADLRIDGPKLTATLADGTLDLRELSGKAFGGSFAMTGQVAAAAVPKIRYKLNVADTDAAAFVKAGQGGGSAMLSALELIFPVSALQIVSGKLGTDIDVTAEGRSQLELVSNLDGTGAMSLTNAVLDGIDTCRVSNQLGQLNGLPAFLALIGSARGGQTRIANFKGSYTLADGIATLPQQTVAADCGTATFAGTVDLPRWTIDLTARATFPEHRNFPGLVIEQKGPLDAPNVRLANSNAVQQYILGNAAQSLIRKLVPKEAQPAPSGGATQPQTQPAQPTKPADQFRNLLDGLIKR